MYTTESLIVLFFNPSNSMYSEDCHEYSSRIDSRSDIRSAGRPAADSSRALRQQIRTKSRVSLKCSGQTGLNGKPSKGFAFTHFTPEVKA